MKSSLTGYDLFATIMMTRQVDKRLVIVLESEEDCGVIDPHLNSAEVYSEPGFGKVSVLEAAGMVAGHASPGILCLVDADFDRLTGADGLYPSGVESTEFYDLDSDIIFHDPDAMRTLAINFSKREPRSTYLISKAVEVDEIVVEVSTAVGALRKISISEGHNFSLNSFPMQHAVAGYDLGQLLPEVIKMAELRSPSVPPGTVEPAAIVTEIDKMSDPRSLCRGHDMLSALSVLIRSWGGRIGHKDFESAARARVSCAVWSKTKFYKVVADWAAHFSVHAWTCV